MDAAHFALDPFATGRGLQNSKRENNRKQIISCCGIKNSCISTKRQLNKTLRSTTLTQKTTTKATETSLTSTSNTVIDSSDISSFEESTNNERTESISEVVFDPSTSAFTSEIKTSEIMSRIASITASTSSTSTPATPTESLMTTQSSPTSTTHTSPVPVITITIITATDSTTSTTTSTTSTTSTTKTPTTSSTTPTTSTPTTTTSTTTIPTTTTTAIPTMEELILGRCEMSVPKNLSLFEYDGSLKWPDKYGYWEVSCGRLFLFGKFLVPWRENLIKCQQIGMEAIYFESPGRTNCFKNIIPKWKYGSKYWTSGLRVIAGGFSWCSANASIPIDASNLPWALGQPDNANNSENCMRLRVIAKNASIQFYDHNCTQESLFACQGPTTPAPACITPICPNVTCEQNMSFYKNRSNELYLINPRAHGYWFTYQSRMYLISYPNDTQTFPEAITTCCQFGMSLISLDFGFKLQSILQNIMKIGAILRGEYFWTSGTNRGCNGNFGFCTVQRPVRRDAIWAPGQPDNKTGNENSLAVYINSTHVQLLDFNEDKKFRYICEIRDNSNSKTGGSPIKQECSQIHNMNDAEIDNLLNNTDNMDLKSKRFVRCVGEYMGILVDGKFMDNKVMAVLETMANDSAAEFTKNMEIMNECESSTGGMNEDDKAAQILKCSNQKAPGILKSVIKSIDQSIPKERVQNYPEAYCPPYNNCTVNTTMYNDFLAASYGTWLYGYGIVTSACGRKWIVVRTNPGVNLPQAYQACCEFGLKLASFSENATETFNCVADSIGYAGRNVWLAVSRLNSINRPRWCSSDAPFSIYDYPGAQSITTNDPSKDTIYFNFMFRTISVANQWDGGWNALCQTIDP
ncbi:uncharacterized protein LOC132200498 isoform X2 [Neocloeon triangulifer]|uniref:uncharacterized protein LOC132200498 isoform X2 n=1 Tax=Neocloeon triangulifer TaxID=2078957 RepID=UPI00286F5CE8|nr:uncharacterized protein LOC132200498 isoform X2 [Neocloeon triangulifer]